MDIAQESRTSIEAAEVILGFLIRQKSQTAIQYLMNLCTEPRAIDPGTKVRIAVAVALMLKHGCREGWSHVWPLFRKRQPLARAAIERIAGQEGYRDEDERLARKLSESQLHDLYLWMRRNYPPCEDPVHEGAYSPDLRDHLQTLRDGLLSELADRGTVESCRALEQLAGRFHSDRWMKSLVGTAREAWRQRSWLPLTAKEFLALAAKFQARAIFDEDHLLEVALEAIEDFGRQLRLDRSLLEALWNRRARGCFRPKDEVQLADLINSHLDRELRRKGIVVNREVQVRRGQKTDIRVDAFRRETGQPEDRLTVIIEVKGSWNPDLLTAMEAQLARRYLDDNRFTRGVYVAGWYTSQVWDRRDYRRRRSTIARDDLARRLDEQTRGLTSSGRRICSCVLDCSLDGKGNLGPLLDRRTISKIADELLRYLEHELLPVMEQITMRRHRRFNRRQLKRQLESHLKRMSARIIKAFAKIHPRTHPPAEVLRILDEVIGTMMVGSRRRKVGRRGAIRELVRRGNIELEPVRRSLAVPRRAWDEILADATEPLRRELQPKARQRLGEWQQAWWRSSATVEVHQLAVRVDQLARRPLAQRPLRRLEQIANIYEKVAVLYELHLTEHLLMLQMVFGGAQLPKGRRSTLGAVVREAKKWPHLQMILEPANVDLRNALHHGRYHFDYRKCVFVWKDADGCEYCLRYRDFLVRLRRLWGATALLVSLPFAAQVVRLKQAWQGLRRRGQTKSSGAAC